MNAVGGVIQNNAISDPYTVFNFNLTNAQSDGANVSVSGKVTTGGQLDKQMIGGLVIPGTGANSGTVS